MSILFVAARMQFRPCTFYSPPHLQYHHLRRWCFPDIRSFRSGPISSLQLSADLLSSSSIMCYSFVYSYICASVPRDKWHHQSPNLRLILLVPTIFLRLAFWFGPTRNPKMTPYSGGRKSVWQGMFQEWWTTDGQGWYKSGCRDKKRASIEAVHQQVGPTI